jgi:hypothetical protein
MMVRRILLNSYDNPTPTKPFFAWLGGDARIGKSHVIWALLALASSWQQSNFVMVVAQMGIVVVNAEGRTIHATFNFNLHGKSLNAQPTIKDIEYFAGLRMLIIEEASTCAQAILGSIDVCLKQLKEWPTIVVDGTHIFHCGDWFQLGLTIGPTLFTQPSPKASIQNRANYKLYKEINHSIYLIEIM